MTVCLLTPPFCWLFVIGFGPFVSWRFSRSRSVCCGTPTGALRWPVFLSFPASIPQARNFSVTVRAASYGRGLSNG